MPASFRVEPAACIEPSSWPGKASAPALGARGVSTRERRTFVYLRGPPAVAGPSGVHDPHAEPRGSLVRGAHADRRSVAGQQYGRPRRPVKTTPPHHRDGHRPAVRDDHAEKGASSPEEAPFLA